MRATTGSTAETHTDGAQERAGARIGHRRGPRQQTHGIRGRGWRLLAWLTLAGALLAAAGQPAHAQTETTVWTATLTVGTSGTNLGYSTVGSTFGSLAPSTFTEDDTTYSVSALATNAGETGFSISQNGFGSAVRHLTLRIGSSWEGKLGDATETPSGSNAIYRWSTAPALTDGAMVTVKLVKTATPPDAPTNVRAVPAAMQSDRTMAIKLSWDAPAYTGTSALTEYSWQRATSRTGPWSIAITENLLTQSVNVTGLAEGTTYYFRVRAHNGSGTGANTSEWSTIAYATTYTSANVPAAPPEADVPFDWALKPTGLAVGTKFRLLFLDHIATRDATATDIEVYNRHVQAKAAAGHSAIQAYSRGFRVVGSTGTVDARDNTATTGTGVAIYWLNGTKVADNYADFYDGAWDDETAPRTEDGVVITGAKIAATGSTDSGTKNTHRPLGSVLEQVIVGELNSATDKPLSGGTEDGTSNWQFYGLSQVLKVVAAAPSAPRELTGTRAAARSMNFTWTDPESNGGSAVTHYSLETATSTSGPWTAHSGSALIGPFFGPASTPWTVQDLAANTTHYFRLRAHNAQGASAPSNIVTFAIGTVPVVDEITVISTGPQCGGRAYEAGDTIKVGVSFDHPVTVVTTGGRSPELGITFCIGDRAARYSSSESTTSRLVFTRTVANSDLSCAGRSFQIGADALDLNGAVIHMTGDIEAHADEPHTVTWPAAGTPGLDPDGRLIGNHMSGRVAIDNVTVSTTPAVGDTYRIGEPINLNAAYQSTHTGLTRGAAKLELRLLLRDGTDTEANRRKATVGSAGLTGVTFGYTVREGDVDTDGISIPRDAYRGNGGHLWFQSDDDRLIECNEPTGPHTNAKIDGVRPKVIQSALSSNRTTVTLRFSEALQATTAPGSAFTVTTRGGGSTSTITVISTSASGSTVTLNLAAAVQAGRTVTVAYTDPSANDDTNAVQDTVGNDAGSFSARMVGATATGQPAITGIAQVGQTLTAGTGTITDADGTTKADAGTPGHAYTYQWVRVDGTDETDIDGATASTYTLAAADLGKRVKVKVSFHDDEGDAEGPLASAAYPTTGTVGRRTAACTAASQTGRIWSETLTTETTTVFGTTLVGWGGVLTPNGALGDTAEDRKFRYGGESYELSAVYVSDGDFFLGFPDSGKGTIANAATREALTVHVDGIVLAGADAEYQSAITAVQWEDVGLAWTGAEEICLAITIEAPTIESIALTSDPDTTGPNDDTYAIGDIGAAKITFSQAVDVKKGSGQLAPPGLQIEVDDYTGVLTCAEATNVTEVTCTSTLDETAIDLLLVAGVTVQDDDGVSVPANPVDLRGGAIVATGTNVNANLAHAGLADDPGHKVDYVRPTVSSAVASSNRDKIVVTFSEPIDSNVPLGGSGFTITNETDSDAAPTVNASSRDGTDATKLVLTLASALDADKEYHLDYTVPTSGNVIKDSPGNAAKSFEDQEVTVIQPTWELAVTGTETDSANNPKVVEGGATITATVRITNAARFGDAQTIGLFFDGKPLRGATGSEPPGSYLVGASNATAITLDANAASGSLVLSAHDDNDFQPTVTASLEARHGSAYSDTAVGTGQTITYENDEPVPSIQSIALTSDPDATGPDDDTYHFAQDIVALVTFDRPIDARGTPSLWLLIKTGENLDGLEEATCANVTNSTTMSCTWQVAQDTTDGDGIGIGAEGVDVAKPGQSIKAHGTDVDANLDYPTVEHIAGHKVDSVLPVLTDVRANSDRTKVILTYNEAMSTTVPADADPPAFTVVNETDTDAAPTVTGVARDSDDHTKIVLTLSAALDAAKEYTLDYTGPDTDWLRDAVGNGASNFENEDIALLEPTWEFTLTGTATDENANPKAVEGGASVTATIKITNAARFGDAQTITLFLDGTPLRGHADTALPASLVKGAGDATAITLPANAATASLILTAHDDDRYWPAFTGSLVARHGTAVSDDQLGDAKTLAYENNDAVPSVASLAFTSDPNDDGRAGDDDTYAIGDTIEATVTFTAPVDVTYSPGTVPNLLMRTHSELGPVNIELFCTAAEETKAVACETTLTDTGEIEDDNGIGIEANSLTAGGGAIVASGTEVAATLTHARVADNAGHKIDAVRPAASEVRGEGDTVTIEWSEALTEADPTAPGGFTLTETGGGTAPTVTGVSIDGNEVTLRLDAELDTSKDYTLAYAAPTNDPVRDAVGNPAANFSGTEVVTVVITVTYHSDTTEDGTPVLVEGGNGITVTATLTGGTFDSDVTLRTLRGSQYTVMNAPPELTINAGETTASATITARDDEAFVPAFTFEVETKRKDREDRIGATQVRWRDDESPPTATLAGPATGTEGETITLTVSLSEAYGSGGKDNDDQILFVDATDPDNLVQGSYKPAVVIGETTIDVEYMLRPGLCCGEPQRVCRA